jgi:site-specific recombinase XerD
MNARPKIGRPPGAGDKRMKKREIGCSGEAVKCSRSWNICSGWTDYLLSARGLTEGTVSRYRRLVERLLADCGKPFPEVTRGDVEKHLRRLHLAGRGESVRQGVVVAVRSLGAWCLAHGLVEVNPGASLSGPRPYRREIKVLTVAEVGRLLWGDRPGTLPRDPLAMRDRVLLGVAYMAGLRASEIGPLEAEGVMWHSESQVFSVLVRRGKGAGGDVRLPLDRQVSRMLGMWLTARGSGQAGRSLGGRFLWGRCLTRWGVRKILLRRCAEVGIEVGGRRLSPHLLRHSLATHLLAEGLDLRQVQLLLRHRSIATTEQYLHADVDRLGALLVRRSPLEARGRRKKAGSLRPAMAQLLEELRGIGRVE